MVTEGLTGKGVRGSSEPLGTQAQLATQEISDEGGMTPASPMALYHQ